MERIKSLSSKWVREELQGYKYFRWQKGYGCFSVSLSQRSEVIDYIAKQEEHHRKILFQDEYRLFLNRYEIAYDEKYVWD